MAHPVVIREFSRWVWSCTSSAGLHGFTGALVIFCGWSSWLDFSPLQFAGEPIVIHVSYANVSSVENMVEPIELLMPQVEPVMKQRRASPEAPPPLESHEIESDLFASPLAKAKNEREQPLVLATEPATLPRSLSGASSSVPVAEKVAGTELPEEPAQFSSTPLPQYPAAWRARGWSGTVLLRLHVSATGDVEKVELATSSGFPELDASAQRAVSLWRGRPAFRAGRAVASQALLPIVFDASR